MVAAKVVEASDVVEDAKEIVEDSIELVEDTASWISRNPKALVFSAILVGAAVGSAVTYLVASKRLQTKYEQIAEAEIEDVKNHYAILHKEGEHGDLAALASKYDNREEVLIDREKSKEIIREQEYTSYDKITLEDEEVTIRDEDISVTQAIVEAAAPRDRNIFESDDPEEYFNFDEELKRREEKPEDPFVITKDEFDNNETDYNQTTLTYYEGDDTLCDEQDKAINEIERLVGSENLLRFGHGSGDKKVVYVRNNRLSLDIEIVQHDGKFAKEVLGFDDSLQHSDSRRPRKFRSSDD